MFGACARLVSGIFFILKLFILYTFPFFHHLSPIFIYQLVSLWNYVVISLVFRPQLCAFNSFDRPCVTQRH